MNSTLLELAVFFTVTGLLAVGGGDATLPTVQGTSVSNGWVTQLQFAEIFAMGPLAPGPSTFYVAGIGFIAAGLPGALVAGLCYVLPPAIIVMIVSRFWHRWDDPEVRASIRHGLMPVTVGLIAAAVVKLKDASAALVDRIPLDDRFLWALVAVLVVGATVLAVRFKTSPLKLVLGCGGLSFVAIAIPLWLV